MRKLALILGFNLALLLVPAFAQASSVPAYRMYNPVTGEHFTTSNLSEAVANGCPNPGFVLEHSGYFNADTSGSATSVERLYNPKTGDHIWTLSSVDISNAIADGYFDEVPEAFLAYSTPQAGGVTVYRVYNPKTGMHFYTTSSVEAANAVAAGYTQNDGPIFYFSSSASQPVDRLYSPTSGEHFYTANPYETNAINCLNPRFSQTEAYYDVQTDSSTGAVPVYRLVDNQTGKHFLTISTSERDAAIAAGYISEGIAFYAFSSSTGGHVPVYRAYDTRTGMQGGDHLYTIDVNEYDKTIATYNGYSLNGYVGEGIAFYVDLITPQPL